RRPGRGRRLGGDRRADHGGDRRADVGQLAGHVDGHRDRHPREDQRGRQLRGRRRPAGPRGRRWARGGCGGDRGGGVVGTSIVFLLFLYGALQVVLGLYATTVLRATVHDAAARAAAGGGTDPASLERIAADAEASLGAMGRRPSTVVTLEVVDEDGDGVGDVVV